MATVNDCINTGQSALTALYNLQTAAMQSGDLSTQKALEDDIDDLTYKLTQLRRQQIADNDAQINALNNQLNQVTTTAQSALGNLSKLTDVLNDIVAASQAIDGILKAVA